MPDLEFKCPHCETILRVDDSAKGAQVTCPSCSGQVIVPVPSILRKRPETHIPRRPSPPLGIAAGTSANVPLPSTAAVWSLVLGILSVLCLGLVAGIPAVICGHAANARIKAEGGALTATGLATAGLVMGYLSIMVSVLILFVALPAIAIPSFMKARTISQKNACINNLRQMEAAKEQWALETKQNQGAEANTRLCNAYLKASPTCPAGGTYTYGRIGENATCSEYGHDL